MKLYWRYKKNGAWTWKAAEISSEDASIAVVLKENMYEYIPLEEY